ncbi:MAG: hypothetical protein HQ523_12510 [Lentisphaerae bacterium]|nr:hypothetical protein [Lentisphaerota bacterium]
MQTRIGLFGIGLETYWPQFDGLRDRLVGYQNQIGERIKRHDVDLVICQIGTYAPSNTLLPAVRDLDVPVVLLVPGPGLNLGDTNCRVRFDGGLRELINRWSVLGPTHHGVLGLGHHLDALRKMAIMLDVPLDTV